MITIKKYPNRRLYDTSQSRYINMDAVKSMIRRDQEFIVQDSKTGDDLTRQILMQIICEHEGQSHSTVLPRALLKQLIRQYGTEHQGLLRRHLDSALARFLAELEHDPAVDEGGSGGDDRAWPVGAGEALPLEDRRSYLSTSGLSTSGAADIPG